MELRWRRFGLSNTLMTGTEKLIKEYIRKERTMKADIKVVRCN